MSTFRRAAPPADAPRKPKVAAPKASHAAPRPDTAPGKPARAAGRPAPSRRAAAPRHSPEGERLSKRVMAQKGCSRSEAEQYIEGGWVRVDGTVVEEPPHRVHPAQAVTMDAAATLLALPDVTLLLHKPPGWDDGVDDEDDDADDAPPRAPAGSPSARGRGPARTPTPRLARALLEAPRHWSGDASGIRLLKRHLRHLEGLVPLEVGASGLLVFTQDWRVARKLHEDMGVLEHELMAEVRGLVPPEALQRMGQLLGDARRRLPHTRFSLSSSSEAHSRIRFAIKGAHPGLVDWLCREAGLHLQGLRRIRLGRIALSELPEGQWRFLAPFEKF